MGGEVLLLHPDRRKIGERRHPGAADLQGFGLRWADVKIGVECGGAESQNRSACQYQFRTHASPLSALFGRLLDPALAAIDGGNGMGTQACRLPQP